MTASPANAPRRARPAWLVWLGYVPWLLGFIATGSVLGHEPFSHGVFAPFVDAHQAAAINVAFVLLFLWWHIRRLRAAQAEHAQAEAELRATEARYRHIVETTLEGVWIIDAEARTTFVSPRMAEMLGYAPAEMLGSLAGTFMDEAEREVLRAKIARRREGIAEQYELCFRHHSGMPVWTRLSANPIVGEDGRYAGSLAMITDITEQRQLEHMRSRSLAAEEERRRAEEASRLKGQFLAHMSHELRTPLNAILGFAEPLHDGRLGPLDATHREYLGDIVASARHLRGLISEVLDLAKIEAGKMELRPEPADVAALIREVADILRGLAARRHVRIEFEVDAAIGPVVIDPARFKQVLYNYLSNALKFAPEHGVVTVRARGDGAAHFRLEVEDAGPGIAEADLPKLFVEFQQLDLGGRQRPAGTGLGLALTRRIVGAQGGQVGVRSAPERGSVFFARLPRHSRPAGAVDPGVGPAPVFEPWCDVAAGAPAEGALA